MLVGGERSRLTKKLVEHFMDCCVPLKYHIATPSLRGSPSLPVAFACGNAESKQVALTTCLQTLIRKHI